MKFLILAACFIAVWAVEAVEQSSAVPLWKYFTQNHVENKIIQGQLAARGQFPHQAYLLSQGSFSVACGGSLISSRYILTAAHCVLGFQSWQVKLGGLYTYTTEPGEVRMTSYKAYVHPSYDSNSHNDVAIIELPQDVQYSDVIKPIRLPRRSEYSNSLDNLTVYVSGWGRTTQDGYTSTSLYWTQLTTISNSQCASYYMPGIVVSSTLCASGAPYQSTCQGDSGGGLIRRDSDGQYTHIGVVSFVHGSGCALGYPSAYMRTAYFLDWISSVTGIPSYP